MTRTSGRILVSGAVGGAATAVGFAAPHHLLPLSAEFGLVAGVGVSLPASEPARVEAATHGG
jgi:hypothetical protein